MNPCTAISVEALWQAAFSWYRRRGNSHHDAEDLVQGVFEKLIRRGTLEMWLQAADAESAIRQMLSAASRFGIDSHRRQTAERRGGGAQHLSLEAGAEKEDPVLTPIEAIERAEVLEIGVAARARLRWEYAKRGRDELFAALAPTLDGEAVAAPVAAMKPATLRVCAVRFRKRYREIVREEWAEMAA